MRLNSGKSSSRIFYVEQRAAGSKATCSSDVNKELKDPQMKFSGNIEYHRAHVNSLVNLNLT